jgi:hypothetical protein
MRSRGHACQYMRRPATTWLAGAYGNGSASVHRS